MSGERIDTRFLILPAGPADAEDLARVHIDSWRETYRGLLSDAWLARMSPIGQTKRFAQSLSKPGPDGVTLIAADPWEVVGYAQGGRSRRGFPGEAEIMTLYLLRAAQGQGLGRRLLTNTARALAAQGARTLVISVLHDNLAARSFYEHLGGAPEPARRERGPDGGAYLEVAYVWPRINVLTG
jgi:ribosomal protein S18 acetylase RimI-like enzyme